MSKKKPKDRIDEDQLKSSNKGKLKKKPLSESKKIIEATQNAGIPDVDLKKFLGCGG